MAERLTICTGSELLQLKACSTECPTAAEVTCGQAVENGCGGPCEGTGTALDPVQCLSKVSTTACGETVVDGCDNPCNQPGTALNVASCADPAAVTCGVPIEDPCGNSCGQTGTAFDPTPCEDPATVACGLDIEDACGNDCGGPGTQCPGSDVCLDDGCLPLGAHPGSAALTCKHILESNASTGSQNYWLDPDGDGGLDPFQVFCDMDTEGGGWIRISYAADLPYQQQFGASPDGSDFLRYLNEDFSLELSVEQIAALHQVTTEGRQTYVGLCNGVLHYKDGNNCVNAFGFRFLDGTETPAAACSYAPFDISVPQDGCDGNGGENGQLSAATIFEIRTPHVPVTNVNSVDNGGNNELFGSPLTDNPAWLR